MTWKTSTLVSLLRLLRNSCQWHHLNLYSFGKANNAYRDGDFALVDAEPPDNSRVLTVVAGPEQAKIQLPRTLSCTMSPVIADMMQKMLSQQKKNLGAFEHVPRFKMEYQWRTTRTSSTSPAMGKHDSGILPSSCATPTQRPSKHYLTGSRIPAASVLSDGYFRRMLLFDLTEKHEDNCRCGHVDSRTPGMLSPSIYCPEHNPNVAISLICFAEEFQMTKLQKEITRGLLISCGIDQAVGKQVEDPRMPNSISFQRCVADMSNFKNAIQYFRLTLTEEAAVKGATDLTGAEYKVAGLRKGELEEINCSIERMVSFWGCFEVYFDMDHMSQESLVSRLKRAVLGK